MARTTHQALVCAYPGCENEPRPGEAGAKPKYCGLPDPVSGKPHTALSAFRRREELARQGGGMAEAEDPGRPGGGGALWHPRRHGGAHRQRRDEADAGVEEARCAALEADAQLAEALAAIAAAQQAAAAPGAAAQARAAGAGRAAEERVLAAQRERDYAVAGAHLRAAEAESRAGTAEQE